MSTILTVRLNDDIKQRGADVLRRNNITPSEAVQGLYDYMILHDKLPFSKDATHDKREIKKMVAALDAFHTNSTPAMSAKELREARLKERYG